MPTALYETDYQKADQALVGIGRIRDLVAHAIAEERERCARIAETAPSESLAMWDRPGGPPGNGLRKTTGIDIARLIRGDYQQR